MSKHSRKKRGMGISGPEPVEELYDDFKLDESGPEPIQNMLYFDPELVKEIQGVLTRNKESGPELILRDFNLYGYILYDLPDTESSEFMSKYGGWIGDGTGEKCWITIFQNPEKWGETFKESMKKIFGDKYEEYLKKWTALDPSYCDRSIEIARELEIPIKMFPCIIFQKNPLSKEYILYPLINDVKFYRDLFDIVEPFSRNPNNTIEDLKKQMKTLNNEWFIPDKIEDRSRLYIKYANIIKELSTPIFEIINPIINLIPK